MVLVFGDTHRNLAALATIEEIIRTSQPELFVHTGDNFTDFELLSRLTGAPGYGVRGNCDSPFALAAPESIIFEYQGLKFLLTHGHKYGAKYSTDQLVRRGQELGVAAVIFGHSHVQFAKKIDGIWLVNPGSIPLPRRGSPGYARLEVKTGQIQVELLRL